MALNTTVVAAAQIQCYVELNMAVHNGCNSFRPFRIFLTSLRAVASLMRRILGLKVFAIVLHSMYIA